MIDKEFQKRFGNVKTKIKNLSGMLGREDYQFLKSKIEEDSFFGYDADVRIRLAIKLGMKDLAKDIFTDNYF